MKNAVLGERVSRWKWVCTGWRIWAFGAVAVLLVGILVAGFALTRRPAWYQPLPVDPAWLHADKAALIGLEDEISAALNAGRPIRFELREDQLNRWLAARADMWPEAVTDFGGLEQPWVSLVAGTLRGAATVRRGGVRGVLVLTGRVDVTDDTITVHWDTARLGAVPIPQKWVSYALAQLPPSARVTTDEGTAGMVALRNELVWPNGRRHFRLREFQVSDGAVNIMLEPLATRPR